MDSASELTTLEIRQHSSRESCWIIINKAVYDVTDFLDSHPGGQSTLLKYGGRDATAAFVPIHASDTLEKYLKPHQCLGPVTISEIHAENGGSQSPQELADTNGGLMLKPKVPRLSTVISISDFEKCASETLPAKSFAFFKTGAESNISSRWNRQSWDLVRFRPRVLQPIPPAVDTSCTLLGNEFSVPFFICPAGGGKLAHPSGEVLLTKAASKHKMLQWVCNNAGCTQKEIADSRGENQVLYWQIYAKADLHVTETEVKKAIALGYKGFALTVDAIRPGKRELDMRTSMAEEKDFLDAEDEDMEEVNSHEREPTVKRPPVWSEFNWVTAVKWLRSLTNLPIAIKGIQCWEDAALCAKYGVHPWISNHGGRQLDGAPSAIETLTEIRKYRPDIFESCEVIVDGGVERGADIVKALALGAKAVGVGRPFLYAMTFGDRGVSKAYQILLHEMQTTMALIGVRSIKDLKPTHVDASGLSYRPTFTRSIL